MNKLPLLNPKVASKSSKGKENIKLVKADCRLFSNLYIASQSRAGDLVNFFSHENHAFPVSLSEYGKLCEGQHKKSKDFFRVNDNKTELFKMIADVVTCKCEEGIVEEEKRLHGMREAVSLKLLNAF